MRVITDHELLREKFAHLFPKCERSEDKRHLLELHKIKARGGRDTYTFWCKVCRGTFTFALEPEVSAQVRAVLKTK